MRNFAYLIFLSHELNFCHLYSFLKISNIQNLKLLEFFSYKMNKKLIFEHLNFSFQSNNLFKSLNVPKVLKKGK